ncbi:MAG TPA: NlpC/P60 family protein [Balneolaceae bacterium]|nr:NlpC/P60 family protein [Balneolaceae bacterium]
MVKTWHIPTLLLTVALMMSCGVAKRTVRQSPPTPHPSHRPKPSHRSSPPATISVSKYNEVKASLKQAYRDWKGTPYKWGGESHHGIDCSGFTQLVFKRYFGVDLPRTTRRQLYAGSKVSRQNLKSGDLVFFKTGRKRLHVGIIVKGKKFLQASVSQGVIISSLKKHYWESHYLTARQVMHFQ